jgi:adenylyltransferase/sulfurtransferase
MAVTVLLPTALQRYAENKEQLEVSAANVGDALRAIIEQAPLLGKHLFDANGNIRSFVNVYLGDDDTRFLEGGATPVKDGDVLTIVPSIAGGTL